MSQDVPNQSEQDQTQPPQDKQITLNVQLDEKRIAETIHWHATDAPHPEPQACDAFLLSIWDAANKATLRIDLWTKEMKVDQMNAFVLQTLMTMADTFQNATNNQEQADEIRAFTQDLATRLQLPAEE
ncbi:MAG: gliding motility protein GldC [Acidobacteriota bacterium]|nr:gliding motility protein GldC [Acidobacteriota bacterium]